MIRTQFNCHFFDSLTFEQFYNYFSHRYDFQTAEYAKQVYNDWLIYFNKISFVFYKAQYTRHRDIVEREFSTENHIPKECDPSEYGLYEKWKYFSEEKGLLAHYEQLENLYHSTERRENEAKLENNVPDFCSIGELAQKYIRERNDISLNRRPSTKVINELWFNSTINNSDEIISELRKTHYPDYLKTKHWQRIRAAMMMIHKASCQAEGHYEQFESWYFGGESDIDVHHLHYRNIGNERYADLALLCKDHHKLWHHNYDNMKPQIKILDVD
jgi:hypothetical protein